MMMSWLFSAFQTIHTRAHTHTEFWQFLLYLSYTYLLLISDDAETVDDTLIVNGTSSSQEKAEISGKFFVYVIYF